jgi:hypothetical protein
VDINRIKSNPASLQTRASSQKSKSSKNRRKHEKKKYSTKEGSAFEDIALIASLHDLISKVYAMTGKKIINCILVFSRAFMPFVNFYSTHNRKSGI